MSIAMFKKRKPKWKIKEERAELQLQQQRLRKTIEALEARISELKDEEIQAFKDNDGTKIAELEVKIDDLKEKVSGYDKRYRNNAEVLEIYSKVGKNDVDGSNGSVTTAVGVITGLGGLALGWLGLRDAYKSDIEGSLSNKKTLDWTKSFPIFKSFGKK